MKIKKDVNFNFQGLNKKFLDEKFLNKNTLDTTILDTLSVQLITIITYSMLIFLMLKFFSVNLSVLFFLMAKVSLTINAISQATKYFKVKDLKNQLANGFINMALLTYVMYGDFFQTINGMTQKMLNFLF